MVEIHICSDALGGQAVAPTAASQLLGHRGDEARARCAERVIDEIGEDNVLFETDFPHPACQYPNAQAYLADMTASWSETRRRKILQDNAARLYRVDLGA